ncbi:DUF1232 domain-containing protein [Halobacillus litoralis]|uniref:DUF1232 domain-containing protein n=1 Tax=Halobacillus litoralis TaxID=45668 RepID=A0A845DY86_9BACI|nr:MULTISPECIES: YkvA family protein [Halobacillus]MCA1022214.1 DUF1232 domain-containing protein [Halobacillus litoralis]MYL21415.1 DUF1232 domain-containing protein [Halobacillus litoralis]MYL30129.1 DUF1232 domain-containing protein [Halobacillus halophilus]MYL37405.1 DUF1232 domain-containing protein [Halobacillus litoralis]
MAEKRSWKNLRPTQLIARSRGYFSEKETLKKLKAYSSRLGTQFVYYSLLLYYAFQSPNTPKKAKLTIAGALGYLILPVDAVPDVLPAVGFTDDSAVILYAVYQVLSHIDDEVKEQAGEKVSTIFGRHVSKDELKDPEEDGEAGL